MDNGRESYPARLLPFFFVSAKLSALTERMFYRESFARDSLLSGSHQLPLLPRLAVHHALGSR